MKTRMLLLGACVAGTIAGCPGPSESPDAYVETDTGVGDAGRDAGPPSPDTGVDANVGPDMGVDGGTDAGPSVDAFVPVDAFAPACGTTCDDGDPCNGVETCDATSGSCVPGTALSCDDGMACTTDSCVAGVGCHHDEGDTDGDGVLDCTDCAPSDRSRFQGAPETCNSIDDDCDTNIDEDIVSFFYADCDGDGWAAAGANQIGACTLPPDDPGCGTTSQSWTARFPDPFVDYDCDDDETAAHSHALTYQTTPMITLPDTGLGFDYDCDAMETPQFGAVGSCTMSGTSCVLAMGWMGSVAACGDSAAFITACGAGCTPTTVTRTQACR